MQNIIYLWAHTFDLMVVQQNKNTWKSQTHFPRWQKFYYIYNQINLFIYFTFLGSQKGNKVVTSIYDITKRKTKQIYYLLNGENSAQKPKNVLRAGDHASNWCLRSFKSQKFESLFSVNAASFYYED